MPALTSTPPAAGNRLPSVDSQHSYPSFLTTQAKDKVEIKEEIVSPGKQQQQQQQWPPALSVEDAYEALKNALKAAKPGVERLLADNRLRRGPEPDAPLIFRRHEYLDALKARAARYKAYTEEELKKSKAELKAVQAAAEHDADVLSQSIKAFKAEHKMNEEYGKAERLRQEVEAACIALQAAKEELGKAVCDELVGSELSLQEVLATPKISDLESKTTQMADSKKARRAWWGCWPAVFAVRRDKRSASYTPEAHTCAAHSSAASPSPAPTPARMAQAKVFELAALNATNAAHETELAELEEQHAAAQARISQIKKQLAKL